MASQPPAGAGLQPSRYEHPWIKQMPKGRARAYDMLYTGVTTVLACAFAYGLFETGRGTYFILKDARQRAAAAQDPSKPEQ